MSMNGVLAAVSAERLSEILADPDSFFEELPPLSLLLSPDPPPDRLWVGSQWQRLHYLLTGTTHGGAPPLANAISGGEPFGEDSGYGLPRYLTPDQVREVSASLEAFPREQLRERFILSSQLIGVGTYPPQWDGNEAEFTSLVRSFEKLVRFYSSATVHGQAVLLCLI